MQLTLNGETRTLPDDATITALLETLELADRPCAVEVNQQLVPKREHASTTLSDGDTVEVVTLVGGG